MSSRRDPWAIIFPGVPCVHVHIPLARPYVPAGRGTLGSRMTKAPHCRQNEHLCCVSSWLKGLGGVVKRDPKTGWNFACTAADTVQEMGNGGAPVWGNMLPGKNLPQFQSSTGQGGGRDAPLPSV
jgi:hypothetical protein